MLHRGERIAGADYFDEYGEDSAGAGILKGGGLAGYDAVRERMSPEGLEIKMACRYCGKDTLVTLEWEELFVCGSNGPGQPLLLPTGWKYSENNGTLYPALGCGRCNRPEGFCPHVTPDECRRHVNAAVSRGLINPQQATMWKQKVDANRGYQGG